ncbi:MAG: FG-GAP repeat protein, partial [SAR324 cluster bacterium]|nr:FG-GAP repeat protein [SAR324 cluster bacterium]
KASGFGTSLSPAALVGSNGFDINGVSFNDYSGWSVAGAGDVNGDGYDDVIVGAYRGPNASDYGAAYVVFGGSNVGATGSLELSSLNGTNGFVLNGTTGSQAGVSVAGAGDMNGDGYADVIVGAYQANGGIGASYVVFGMRTGFSAAIDLSTLDGNDGFVINGVLAGDKAGQSVASAGDVNGDGFADIFIGTYYVDNQSGAGYVVFGTGSGYPAAVELSALDGSNGFVINGVAQGDRAGRLVDGAGDVNGDGFADLIIGAHDADPNGVSSGASYVIFGRADWSATAGIIELATLDSTLGFAINGVAGGQNSGKSVNAAGDINGDGFADVLVGAPYATNGSGETYLVFGGDFTGAVTQQGSAGADTLTGTAAADAMVGGAGDDTLVGGGGADALSGGAGDDVLAVSDLGFRRVNGGSGRDTLRLDGSGLSLELTGVAGTSLIDIETIDLNGGGNTLMVEPETISQLLSVNVTFIVEGSAGDAVSSTTTWTLGTAVAGYTVYTFGAITLQVNNAVSQTIPIN